MEILEHLLRQEAATTRHLLLRCRNLGREQLDTHIEEGPGTLHETLIHLVETIELWIDLAQRQPVRPYVEPSEVSESIESLIVRLDAIATESGTKRFDRPGDQPTELPQVIAPLIDRNQQRRAMIGCLLTHFVEEIRLDLCASPAVLLGEGDYISGS